MHISEPEREYNVGYAQKLLLKWSRSLLCRDNLLLVDHNF